MMRTPYSRGARTRDAFCGADSQSATPGLTPALISALSSCSLAISSRIPSFSSPAATILVGRTSRSAVDRQVDLFVAWRGEAERAPARRLKPTKTT
jgi:hypothetical protein